VVRYRLPTELGPFVCNIFRTEIAAIYEEMAHRPTNSVVPKAVLERQACEYTASAFLHLYRFDTVFAADRFGQILQYLQSPADKSADHPNNNNNNNHNKKHMDHHSMSASK
jgi:hypothetical protein